MKTQGTVVQTWSQIVVLGGGLLIGGSLQASIIPIVNPSFEDPVLAEDAGQDAIPGWSEVNSVATDRVGVLDPAQPTRYTGAVPDGDNVAYFWNINSGTSALWQQTGKVLDSQDLSYALSAYIGNRKDLNQPSVTFELRSGSTYAGSTLLKSLVVGAGAVPDDSFSNFTLTWDQNDANFATDLAANLGQNVIVAFRNTTIFGIADEIDIDLVSLEFVGVPEPSVVALLGLGALLAWRRNKLG